MKRSVVLVVGFCGFLAGMLVRPAEANRDERAIAILCERFMKHVMPLVEKEWAVLNAKPPAPEHERTKARAVAASLVSMQTIICR